MFGPNVAEFAVFVDVSIHAPTGDDSGVSGFGAVGSSLFPILKTHFNSLWLDKY